jgi:hypothetical protein
MSYTNIDIFKKILGKRILLFDCETTGLIKVDNLKKKPESGKYPSYKETSKYPRLIQLSYCIIDNYKIDIFNENIINDVIFKPVDFKITNSEIHGITQEEALENGINIKKFLKKFKKELVDIDYILAYNVYFDFNILLHELHLTKHITTIKYLLSLKEKKQVLCVGELCAKYMKPIKWKRKYQYQIPKMIDVYKTMFYKVFKNQHNAKYDLIAMHDIIFNIFKKSLLFGKNIDKIFLTDCINLLYDFKDPPGGILANHNLDLLNIICPEINITERIGLIVSYKRYLDAFGYNLTTDDTKYNYDLNIAGLTIKNMDRFMDVYTVNDTTDNSFFEIENEEFLLESLHLNYNIDIEINYSINNFRIKCKNMDKSVKLNKKNIRENFLDNICPNGEYKKCETTISIIEPKKNNELTFYTVNFFHGENDNQIKFIQNNDADFYFLQESDRNNVYNKYITISSGTLFQPGETKLLINKNLDGEIINSLIFNGIIICYIKTNKGNFLIGSIHLYPIKENYKKRLKQLEIITNWIKIYDLDNIKTIIGGDTNMHPDNSKYYNNIYFSILDITEPTYMYGWNITDKEKLKKCRKIKKHNGKGLNYDKFFTKNMNFEFNYNIIKTTDSDHYIVKITFMLKVNKVKNNQISLMDIIQKK